jgi:hypothetical protein
MPEEALLFSDSLVLSLLTIRAIVEFWHLGCIE